ncbi:hypothetical protein [Neobacillus vireti]|uniref:hypothetical protein n=1 Tax=Neobacillus vireti TaxID=220686 RepID=UPI001364CFEC|nr:hypothetical protein [Neobacillus vireti]
MTVPSEKSCGRAQSTGDFDRSFGKIVRTGTIGGYCDGSFGKIVRTGTIVRGF